MSNTFRAVIGPPGRKDGYEGWPWTCGCGFREFLTAHYGIGRAKPLAVHRCKDHLAHHHNVRWPQVARQGKTWVVTGLDDRVWRKGERDRYNALSENEIQQPHRSLAETWAERRRTLIAVMLWLAICAVLFPTLVYIDRKPASWDGQNMVIAVLLFAFFGGVAAILIAAASDSRRLIHRRMADYLDEIGFHDRVYVDPADYEDDWEPPGSRRWRRFS